MSDITPLQGPVWPILLIFLGPSILVIVSFVILLIITRFAVRRFKISKKVAKLLYWAEVILGVAVLWLVLENPELVLRYFNLQ